MLKSRPLATACLALSLVVPVRIAEALDATRQNVPLPQAADPDAFTKGTQAYRKGDKNAAFKYLLEAGEQGHPVALWHLGRMYAEGDGVPQNSLKAFEYYRTLADNNADVSLGASHAPLVSKAFIALAFYYMEGIPGTKVKQNLPQAIELFTHAATYLGDPDAQFELGRLFLLGRGTEKDQIQAARWFALAARQGHKTAQATLGDLLFRAKNVSRNPAEGLAWLEIAKSQVSGVADSWILLLHEHAFAEATPEDRERAYQRAETLRQTIRSRPEMILNLFELIPSQ